MKKKYNTIPVVAYDLMNENRRLFSSITSAAEALGLNYETARKRIGISPVNGWLLARLDEEELILQKIAEWKETTASRRRRRRPPRATAAPTRKARSPSVLTRTPSSSSTPNTPPRPTRSNGERNTAPPTSGG